MQKHRGSEGGNKILNKSLNVFSTAVLIEDTVNSETNTTNQTETC